MSSHNSPQNSAHGGTKISGKRVHDLKKQGVMNGQLPVHVQGVLSQGILNSSATCDISGCFLPLQMLCLSLGPLSNTQTQTPSFRALILYRRRRFINHLLTYLLTFDGSSESMGNY